jgi:hypothetical protein
MRGEIPAMYWYLFWVGVLAFMIVFSFSMMALISRRNLKALALLKLYAEKGVDPPPTVAALLATPVPAERRRGAEPDAPRSPDDGARR